MTKKTGKIVGIFSAKKGESGLPRPAVKNLKLIENFGIEDDKFAGDELDKSVMVIGLKSYEIAKENGIELQLGSYGENILFDFDPHKLEIGDTIKIDDTILEITQRCTLCSHLSVFHKYLPKLIKNHRGLYCKILKGGEISKESIVSF